jgi:hypothetical protein
MIQITPKCYMHLHGHWNKMVPLKKPSTFVDLNNGAKFYNYICWLTNGTCNYNLLCQISNHHIGNKNMVLMNHVKINS